LGLRKGEVLRLTWELVNLEAAELYVGEQVQRVGRELIRRQVKTETSETPLPLPDLCVAALKLCREEQGADSPGWPASRALIGYPAPPHIDLGGGGEGAGSVSTPTGGLNRSRHRLFREVGRARGHWPVIVA
jgi:hypothetical protein